jgi:hypothetical protein
MIARRVFWLSWCLALAVTDARSELAYNIGTTVDGVKFVRVAGVIGATDNVEAFAAAVVANRVTAVSFASPGGDMRKAMELGRRIRAFRLSTIQTGVFECASACAIAFMGGTTRHAYPDSIGVHRMWYPKDGLLSVDEAVAAVQQVTAELVGYMIEMGADPALLQLAYATDELHYLSEDELAEYRVTTADSADSPAGACVVATMPTWAAYESCGVPWRSVRTRHVAQDGSVSFEQEAYYEDLVDGTIDQGTVRWWLAREPAADGGPPEPVIHAEASIPGRDLQLRMTISRNTDSTLAASHIIELVFTRPEKFHGGGIDRILQFSTRDTTGSTGEPLIAMSARLTETNFIVELDQDKEAIETNLDLLRHGQWIDVPLLSKSGLRAMFSLKSELPDNQLAGQFFDSWQAMADGL